MRVLFLAVGGNRRRAVADEAARVVTEGGRATVVVAKERSWLDTPFAPGVEVVVRSGMELRSPPRSMEWLLLFRLPRKVYRTVGRGPLRAPVSLMGRLHERAARRVQRGVVLPLLRRRHKDGPGVLHGSSYDVIIVGDAASMPDAVKLTAGASADEVRPEVAYSLAHLTG
ncbi:hypothetical protein AB0I28_34015 [Phytomonospora sp. NPDC050363]|uniref:hypothetical protein n=1 Tax=Phytomonospora sp. NPDC050363 TaxID=3155642 RepID=UPI0033FA2B4A